MGRNVSVWLLRDIRHRWTCGSTIGFVSVRPILNPNPCSKLPSIIPAHHHFINHNLTASRLFSSSSTSDFIFAANDDDHPRPSSVEVDDDSFLPVSSVISLLDFYHDLSALPWWIVIASSTVAMRITLFPLLVVQLQKLKTISQLFPRLPPPFPPPLSGRSFVDQFKLFRKQRKEIGCPSSLWFLASISVQIPCFLLLMTSVRKMCLGSHPGFECGGTLWFSNLTEFPHGLLGSIFPLAVGGLHLLNVQLSFKGSSVEKYTNLFAALAKYYRYYLNFLTLPLVFIGYCIPQGSLVYWVTNSSLSVIQHLSLNHPAIRAKLGLPDKNSQPIAASSEDTDKYKTAHPKLPKKWQKIPVEKLSPKQLLSLSVVILSNGKKDDAIPLLRMALGQDPECVRALTVLGQTLLQKGQYAEATEHLESAVSKLLLSGLQKIEDVDLLILASQWAGVASIRQGKDAEGIVHLERVASLEEPEDPKCKVHYFDGLLLLASALYRIGRKAEATRYMQAVVAYNPTYRELLEQCENDEGDIVSDLVNSRRGDY